MWNFTGRLHTSKQNLTSKNMDNGSVVYKIATDKTSNGKFCIILQSEKSDKKKIIRFFEVGG